MYLSNINAFEKWTTIIYLHNPQDFSVPFQFVPYYHLSTRILYLLNFFTSASLVTLGLALVEVSKEGSATSHEVVTSLWILTSHWKSFIQETLLRYDTTTPYEVTDTVTVPADMFPSFALVL